MNRIVLLLILLTTSGLTTYAAGVDTVEVYSKAMKKTARCVVITPEGTAPENGWPVVYLLHGYSGNYRNWIQLVPAIVQYASDFRLMIVCPDGDYSSWYVDSPVDSSMRYATYIAKEVPDYIDSQYPTRRDAGGRAITGLSMGGFGGLYLGLTFRNRFGACGSMSGGVDLNCCRTRFDVSKRIGDTLSHAANWEQYSIHSIVATLKPEEVPSMIIDCGTSDFFYDINAALHRHLLSLKIPHDYIERPGQHNWAYWGNAVQYQLLFFANQFKK